MRSKPMISKKNPVKIIDIFVIDWYFFDLIFL